MTSGATGWAALALVCLTLVCLAMGPSARADDTEIFFGDFSGGDISPNVLFVVDASASMGEAVPGTGMTRIQHVQAALTALIGGLDDVNVGLMAFPGAGDPALFPVDYIDRPLNGTGETPDGAATPDPSVRDGLLAWVASLEGLVLPAKTDGVGDAPIQDMLYRAALYYAGRDPAHGTPIRSPCQTGNHVILLTDGDAGQPGPEGGIEGLIGARCDNRGLPVGERCVRDLARHLNGRDQSSLRGEQRVTTHVVGFDFSGPWLADVAAAGGGQYRQAARARELVQEVGRILAEVPQANGLFVAPVAEVNQFNRLNHRDEVYFALFSPRAAPGWPGNLKKYSLRGSDGALLDSSDPPVPAVDPDTGFFADNARSHWSPAVDGKEVDRGGAESRLPSHASRRLYTHHAGSVSAALSDPANLLAVGNRALTAAMFGVEAHERDGLIEWIRGRDVDDEDGDSITAENRHVLGDPLHSRPVAVTYGGTADEPDTTVFFGTNAGFLHAVNARTGVERFAFLPQDKFDEQGRLRAAAAGRGHIYGLDGSAAVRLRDRDGDGAVEPGDGDFVHIYIGQRRGGRNYYALDVTDRDNPRVLWQIRGGDGGFGSLGQSWARPVPGRIDMGGAAMDVLYIAGGYDEDQDNARTRRADDVGNALYIVDADTGTPLWSGGGGAGHTARFAAMNYSFPATASVADADGDGTDDVIFIGDVGGQLWRFDIHNGAAPPGLVTGGVVADLGVADGDNTRARNRRFYHAPDIALTTGEEGGHYAVTIGSGYRAHPLDTGTVDRFYMLRLPRDFDAATSYTRHTEADLYDASANEIGEGIISLEAALSGARGWYFSLPNVGEKVLSTPLTLRGTVTFTTYQPGPAAGAGHCAPAVGVSRLYQVRLEDASPIRRRHRIDKLTEADRSHTLRHGGIIDEPVVLCVGEGCDVFVGAESLPVGTERPGRVVKSFWRQVR